jgi:hypothetical protein
MAVRLRELVERDLKAAVLGFGVKGVLKAVGRLVWRYFKATDL